MTLYEVMSEGYNYRLPSPRRGRGAGGEGDTLAARSTPETRLWMRILEWPAKTHLCVRPLTPNPSPALGRGGPKSRRLYSVVLNNEES